MEEKIVGFLEKQETAIDYVPIYYFRTTKPIKRGSLIRFDKDSKRITVS